MPTLKLTSFTHPKAAELIGRVSTGLRDAQGLELEGNGHSHFGDIRADGRYAVFETVATNLGSDPWVHNSVILYKDLATGAIQQIAASGNDLVFSPDGRSVIFEGSSLNLPGGGEYTIDIFRKDLETGALSRISATAPDAQGNQTGGNGASSGASFSANGRYVVFESLARNLGGGNDSTNDIFRKDLSTGAIVHVSQSSSGEAADGGSHWSRISADGRYVVFESNADNLVAGDTNGKYDIFRKDLMTGETVRVSTGAGNAQADDDSYTPEISPDGRYVVFESVATNLDGGNRAVADIFRKDLQTGEIVRIGAADGTPADDDSYRPRFTADGHSIVFTSRACNLIDGDRNGSIDVFRIDNELLSHRKAVAEGRYVKASFDVGQASSASIAWGDGASDTLTPSGGKISVAHAYAASGVKAATVTVKEGAQTWIVPYRVDVAAGQMSRDTGLNDTLSGGAGADQLTGDGFGNVLGGKAGQDMFQGGGGNDVLAGGEGRDRLAGGTGSASRDAFLFDTKLISKSVANRHKDTIEDFGPRYDAIYIDDVAFTNKTIAKYLKSKAASLDKPVKLKAGYFRKGDEAQDRDDFFIYNARTKKLYFDVDGSGPKAMVEIASLKLEAGAGKFGANDFFFV